MMAKRRKPLAHPVVVRSLALAGDMIKYVGKHPDVFPDEWYDAIDNALFLMTNTRAYLARDIPLNALTDCYRTLAEKYMPLIRRMLFRGGVK